MPYDEDLAKRIRAEMEGLPGLIEKKMFGGTGFMLRGNMACGVHGDTLKDHLAHVTEWERFLIRNQFEGQPAHLALGIDRAVTEGPDEAGINAALQARNRDRSLPDVLADLGRTHDRVLAELGKRSYAGLQKRTRVMGPDEEPMLLWVIYNTYEHYLEHRLTIEAVGSK